MKRLRDSSDVPEARLGILLKTFTSSKKNKAAFCFPAEERVLPSASTKRAGGKIMMVSKKDLNSAELETMRTSRSPTTVMVKTREEATVYVKQWDLFGKVMFLKETPAVLSFGELCEDHGYTYHWTSGQKPRHPLLHHLHHRIPYVMTTDSTRKSGSTSGELRGDPLHETTETENKKKKGSKEVQRDISHELSDWLQEFRENLVDESTSTEPWRNPEQRSQDTSKSSRELSNGAASKSGAGFGLAQCMYALSEGPKL